MNSMNAAVGPLTTSPSTSGLTATIAAGLSFSADLSSGIARMGPIETIGLEGPMTIACAVAMAWRTSRVGRAARAPWNSTSWTGSAALEAHPALIMYS